MKVADLAADLEVPASTVLDQCQRFGIDASWSGAELRNSDVAILRAELAVADPAELVVNDPSPTPGEARPSVEVDPGASKGTAAEAIDASDPGAVADGRSAASSPVMAPSAVGSMPELLDEITPEPEPEPNARADGGSGYAGAGGEGGGVDPNATRRVSPPPAPAKRRLEKRARNSVIALVIAVACFSASNSTEVAAIVVVLWVLTALALGVAVFDGVRGRRRVQVHPDRLHGLWLATVSLVLACGGLVGLTTAVFATVGDAPATEAPAGVGDLQSVQVARWGYQRASRLADNGWKQPARIDGSCWAVDSGRTRDEQRVEIADATDGTSCTSKHTMQVMKVFALQRDADAPYPGDAKLLLAGQEACRSIGERLAAKDVSFEMKVEYPTEVGWGDGDHDVACVAVTPVRTAPLGT